MANTVDYYLSKGFDRHTAEYFSNGRRQIMEVVPNDNYTLTITFDNAEKRIYDVAPMLVPGTVFAPLSDPETFQRVYLDEQNCIAWDIDPTIDSNEFWNNKIDLSSDSCYLDSIPLVGGAANE